MRHYLEQNFPSNKLKLSQCGAVLPLLFLSLPAFALQTVDGVTRTIGPNTEIYEFRVINGGSLIAGGANTQAINVESGSTLSFSGGEVNAGAKHGVRIMNSQGQLNGTRVISDAGAGLLVSRSGSSTSASRVTVNDSLIRGSTQGASVSAYSELDIVSSTIEGTGATSRGLAVQGGTARVQGSQISGGYRGVLMNAESSINDHPSTLLLDSTHVSAIDGPAIEVRSGNDARITLRNGSTLEGGNGIALLVGGASLAQFAVGDSDLVGNLAITEGSAGLLGFSQSSLLGNLDVDALSAASLTLNSSHMFGDVEAEQGGAVSVALTNGSSLLGKLSNVGQVDVDGNSVWTLTGDSSVGNLALKGGRVSLSENGAFNRLEVENLSGDGAFYMRSNFAKGETDFLNVTGTSSGNHGLLVQSTGNEASVESLHLVQTADGSAQFQLLNDRQQVDVGAYSYSLKQEGNDWLLDRDTRVVSPGTRAAMALFNTPITVAYGELSSLRSRMGELRYSEGRNAGLWMRAYGNRYNVSGQGNGAGYQQNQRGLSLGVDMPITDSDWLVGVLAGSSRSDLNLDHGTSGSVDSYYLGGYATWLDRESGYYLDTVLKYNRYQNNATLGLSDHTRAKGDYDTHGLSASVEAGKHIKLEDGYFVEPFAQVATAVVAGKDYSFSNDLRAQGDTAKSLLGKVGTTLGKTIALDAGGTLQPYLKAALVHELAQRNQVKVNNNVFNNDLSGTRGELGAGVAWAITKQFQVHADVEYSNGKHIEQPYGVNLGVRFEF